MRIFQYFNNSKHLSRSALEKVDDLVATADDWRISSIIPLDCNVQYALEEDHSHNLFDKKELDVCRRVFGN